MPKKKKLSLGSLTVQSFITQVDEGQDKVKGGLSAFMCGSLLGSCNTCVTCNSCKFCPVYTEGCTINIQTCIGDEGGCNPADTFPAGGGVCP